MPIISPPGCCLLHFLHLFCLSFIMGMPNRSCILKLRTNQCFLLLYSQQSIADYYWEAVCNVLCVPRCKSQIAPKKTQCLSCFTRNFRNIPILGRQCSDSKSKGQCPVIVPALYFHHLPPYPPTLQISQTYRYEILNTE